MKDSNMIMLIAVAVLLYLARDRVAEILSGQSARMTRKADGGYTYRPPNPNSGVSEDFGVGYDMDPWLFEPYDPLGAMDGAFLGPRVTLGRQVS